MITPAIHIETKCPWELGSIYAAYLDLGYREIQIAEMVGRSQSTISRYVHIFRGLHEKLVDIVRKSPPNVLELGRVARIRDRGDEPDFERQRKALSKIMNAKTLRRR